jgi:pimeloyl-ACP methyl ester carboxylesterase
MAARAYGRRIYVGGAAGRYTDLGKGPCLVIVASPLTYVSAYQATAGELVRRGFRVITLDLPGGGGADPLAEPWSFERYGEWLAHFVERLDAPVTLIGHSNSADIAVMCAARRPPGLARIVLADAVGGGRLGPVWWVVARHMAEVPMELWFTIRGGAGLIGVLVRHWRNFWSQARLACEANLEAEAGAVRVPTLVAWGRWDLTVPQRLGKRFLDWIPAARWYLSHEGAHDWIMEHPTEFADAVCRFCGTATSP